MHPEGVRSLGWVPGAGQATLHTPHPGAASALLGTSGVHMHAPSHVYPPAHMHTCTRTHTWPPDLEVPGPQRSPGQHWPWPVPGSLSPVSPLLSLHRGGFCPGRGEVCAGAQEVERWVLRGLSGLPVLKEGPGINAAPCPAARAAGTGFPGAGLVERSGPRTQAVLSARLYFRNQIFVLYFPSRGVLVC